MKKNNKGFTLVELIIVMAIIAILAAVIAPNLMHYVNKSKRTKDIATAETLVAAINTVISNEKIYDELITAVAGMENKRPVKFDRFKDPNGGWAKYNNFHNQVNDIMGIEVENLIPAEDSNARFVVGICINTAPYIKNNFENSMKEIDPNFSGNIIVGIKDSKGFDIIYPNRTGKYAK